MFLFDGMNRVDMGLVEERPSGITEHRERRKEGREGGNEDAMR